MHAVAPSIEVVAPDAERPVILLCDHAGHRLPAEFGDLGIDQASRLRHIGWDIGAGEVTYRLRHHLQCTAILNHVSRLVIDPNRRPGIETSIPSICDGTVVPGNQHLPQEEVRRRIRRYFLPYHRAIARAIGRFRRRDRTPVIISVHSFTDRLNGEDRPWQIGVLFCGDRRLSSPVHDALAARGDLLIGSNQPYSGLCEFGYTITFHAQRSGLPHLMLELRQSDIANPETATGFADILAEALKEPLADRSIYQRYQGDNLISIGGHRSWRHASQLSP